MYIYQQMLGTTNLEKHLGFVAFSAMTQVHFQAQGTILIDKCRKSKKTCPGYEK